MPHAPADLVPAAVAAVRAAAAVCRTVQADLVSAATLEKGDKSPVTVADFAAQAVVAAALKSATPDLPLVGEEDAAALRADDQAELRAKVAAHAGQSEADTLDAIDHGGFDPATDPAQKTYWTLDPIDGTKGFLRGQQYAVALALIQDGKVTLGVLGCPNLEGGLLLAATSDTQTLRLPLEGDDLSGTPTRVSGNPDPAAARLVESVESAHSDQSRSAKIAAALGLAAPPVRIDSQCKYAAVALGLADLYLRLPTRPGYREKIWDHAAGMLAVQQAGGTVTDTTGKPLDFAAGRQLDHNAGVIATHGHFHDRVVEAVQDTS
ncbi:MAG: 3'(2'),5'-bisphosphate nucleotidase [Planctomycetota bacterium]